MKQLLQNLRSGETVVADVPVPTPQPGEVLIQTAASLVSAGTERTLVEFAEKSLVGKARSRPDLVRQVIDKARREGLLSTVEAAFNRLDSPMPLGYSSAGTIVELGEGVQGLKVGQRVAAAGGNYAVHAEFEAVPRILVTPIPDHVSFEAAAFTTLGAIAMHGFRLLDVQLGEQVAVIGLGLVGLLAVGIAQAAGCRVLGIDLNPQRVKLAEQMGARAVSRELAEQAAQEFTNGAGCDAVLICADTKSDDPLTLAGVLARDRARVVATGAIGLNMPRKVYYEKELSFINSRSYGPGRYDPSYEEGGKDYPIGYVRWTEGRNMQAVVDLISEGKLDVSPLITHRFPIESAAEAYELITGKTKEPFLGVLLTYPAADDLVVPSGARRVEFQSPASRGAEACRASVLGAGNFATAVLLPAMKAAQGVELVGIGSSGGASAASAAKRFGFRYAASSEHEIIDDPQANTVFILTRHHLHAPQVLSALEKGKHVFCEKPLAIRMNELDSIEALVTRAQNLPILTVGFNRRFAPLAVRLKEFFAGRAEPVVATYRVNAGYLPLNHWTQDPDQGGGRIIGEAVHFVDFLTYLVGDAPVDASIRSLPDGGRYKGDNAVIQLSFLDGSLGVVTYVANGDKSFPKERVEVFGGGRTAALDDFRSLEMVRDGRRQVVKSQLKQDKGHAQEVQAFVSSVISGGSPPIAYQQLFGVHRVLLEALNESR